MWKNFRICRAMLLVFAAENSPVENIAMAHSHARAGPQNHNTFPTP